MICGPNDFDFTANVLKIALHPLTTNNNNDHVKYWFSFYMKLPIEIRFSVNRNTITYINAFLYYALKVNYICSICSKN